MHEKQRKLSPADKAAILLMSLGEDLAAELIRQLPQTEAKRILQTIAQLGTVDEATVQTIQREFYDLIATHRPTHVGDTALTKRILTKAFGNDKMQPYLDSLPTHEYPSFKEAEHLSGKSLHQILEKELPQTVAVILAHLTPKKSGEVLARFNSNEQREILVRMATLQEVNQEVLEDIDSTFGQAIDTMRQRSVTQIGGVDKTAALLATMNQQQREDLLLKLSEKQPALVESIRAQLWTFEDLAKLTAADIEKILRKVSAGDLELALRKSSETLRARIFKSMSERRAQDLKESIAIAKPVPVAKIDDAQRRIATLAAQMIQDGEITDPSEEAV